MISKTKLIALVLAIALVLPFVTDAAVRVRGYTRKDGTYVQPHYRSNPDGNPYNNWSFPGNTNPYTGKVAPGNPDTYLRNYYDKSVGSSYSLPLYSAPAPSYSLPTYSKSVPSHPDPSYSSPPYSPNSVTVKPKATVYRKAKETAEKATGCYISGLSIAEADDCVRYAYNREVYDWEEIDYSPPHQVVNQPTSIQASTPKSASQTASVISPYMTVSQEQKMLITQFQLQIAALQQQLNALLRR